MKAAFIILIFFVFSSNLFSQKTSLIIRTNGDSIICKIDSVSDSFVYLKLRTQEYTWASTSINMSEVASIKNNVAYKDLKSHKMDSISPSKSIYRFHKNSVTLAGDFIFTGWGGFIYTINYERLFPLANNVGMSGRVGLMPSFSYGPPPFLAEVNFLIGKSALIFESAFGLITILDPGYGADLFPYIRINYRLQTSKRFLFKIGPTMYIEEYVFFAAGITLGVTF